MNNRYIELDLLRTLAIIVMVIYHLCYDLQIFYGWNLGMFDHVAWMIAEKMTAGLFLLLVGCSFAISWNRHGKTFISGEHELSADIRKYKKYLLRGLFVIGCGMLVTIATYLMDPVTYVRFGILHMIGVSILLLPIFAYMKEWNALLGMIIVGLGFGLGSGITAQTSLLLPFGLVPPDFATVDYFPLIPWFGVVLIGYSLGYTIYIRRKPPSFSIFNSQFSILAWPGRNALIIYLIHQPIILGILGLFRFVGIL